MNITPYQEQYTTYDQATLFNIHRTNNSETAIVFFHGIGDSHLNYIDFFYEPILAQYDLIVPDLLGHGRSSQFNEYSFNTQVKALYTQLSPLLAKYKQVVFVPHSMGGIHATMLAKFQLSHTVKGIFAIETSITQYGSFIAEKVHNVHTQNQPFSPWFNNFREEIYNSASISDDILRTYYAGLRFVRENAFLNNALEMYLLAHHLTDQVYTHQIGQVFAQLNIPKVYCLGRRGKQLPSLPFLENNQIKVELFDTESHWVAQACKTDFCIKLHQFIQSISINQSF